MRGPYDLRGPTGELTFVLIIQSGDNHMTQIEYDRHGNPTGPVVNGVLETVRSELQLDHHYLPNLKVVLVRIDCCTLDNSVLNDW